MTSFEPRHSLSGAHPSWSHKAVFACSSRRRRLLFCYRRGANVPPLFQWCLLPYHVFAIPCAKSWKSVIAQIVRAPKVIVQRDSKVPLIVHLFKYTKEGDVWWVAFPETDLFFSLDLIDVESKNSPKMNPVLLIANCLLAFWYSSDILRCLEEVRPHLSFCFFMNAHPGGN